MSQWPRCYRIWLWTFCSLWTLGFLWSRSRNLWRWCKVWQHLHFHPLREYTKKGDGDVRGGTSGMGPNYYACNSHNLCRILLLGHLNPLGIDFRSTWWWCPWCTVRGDPGRWDWLLWGWGYVWRLGRRQTRETAARSPAGRKSELTPELRGSCREECSKCYWCCWGTLEFVPVGSSDSPSCKIYIYIKNKELQQTLALHLFNSL